MSTLAERIKERMQAVGLKNADLARACKVRTPTSFNWGSGKTKNIKGEPLLLAAKALGVTPEWLATGKGAMFPEPNTALAVDIAETPPAHETGMDSSLAMRLATADPVTVQLVHLALYESNQSAMGQLSPSLVAMVRGLKAAIAAEKAQKANTST